MTRKQFKRTDRAIRRGWKTLRKRCTKKYVAKVSATMPRWNE